MPLSLGLKDISHLTSAKIPSLAQELQKHQIELEAQLKDIQRLQAELQQSRDKYQKLYDTVPIGYFTIDRDYIILEANAAAAKMLGATRSHLVNAQFTVFISRTQPSQDIFHLCIRKILTTGLPQECELEMQRRNGSRFSVHLQIMPVNKVTGQNSRYSLAITDITERKQTAEVVVDSRRRVSETLNNILDGFFTVDRDWRFTYINEQAASNLGYEPEALIGQNLWEKFPQFKGIDLEPKFRQVMLDGQPQKLEMQGPLTSRWHNVRIYPSKEGISVFWQDITEHKQTEETLRESEQENRVLIETANNIIVRWLSDGTITFINDFGLRFFGYSRDEIIGANINILVPRVETSGRSLEHLVGNIVAHPEKYISYTNENVRKDSSLAYISWANKALYDKSGKVQEILSIGNDVTELKKTQESLARAKDELEIKVQERTKELWESEEKYRLLVENAEEAIIVIQDRRTKFFNHKALKLWGYSSQELRALQFIDLIFSDDKDLVYNNYLKRLRGECVPASYEFRIRTKDGSLKWVNVNAILINWEDRPASLSLLTDITERKNLEQALNNYAQKITRVQEEERKRIAYELHDDTAQYLAILKLQLDALLHSGKIQDPQVLEKLAFLEKDAGRAVDDVRRYSHELRPGVLEHLGLQAALEQIAEDTNKLKQITVKVEVEGLEPDLSEDIKLAFFRIAQEAMNNCRKHSKASLVNIRLQYYQNQMRMLVRDEGIGFDAEKLRPRTGARGNLGLMSMQERANLVGAILKIESQPGQGTTVRVEMPL